MTYVPGGSGGSGSISGSSDVALSNAATGEVLSFDGAVAKWRNAAVDTVSAVTTSATAYTIAATDRGKIIETSATAAVVITVPADATVPFPVGTLVEIYQAGTGQVSIAPSSGVILRSPGNRLKTAEQYSTVMLRKRAADEWVVAGDLVV